MPAVAFRSQPEPAAATAAWFAGPAGQVLLASELDVLRHAGLERPGQHGLWLAPTRPEDAVEGLDVCLHAVERGFGGDLHAGLALPLASESCGVVVIQHLADLGRDPGRLLEECARVLLPGGRLWLLGLNPMSPYRLRWRGQGPRAAEPFLWRRRLRAAGLLPDPVSRGLGPSWSIALDPALQDGAGLRAAFLLRAEKRRTPLTPQRARPAIGWQTGPAA